VAKERNKRRQLNLDFPRQGVDRRLAYQNSPPYTSPSANNVRPDDTLTGRQRGGSRPGLAKKFSQSIGDPTADEIRLLSDVSYVTSNTPKTRLVASAAGDLYREEPVGTMAQVSSALQLSSTYMVMAADRNQKLYIADWDPDATISANARAPKIYDPVANTLTLWSAAVTDGTLPTGCSIVALYRDRLFLAGATADPHQWFASRQGDPGDWDYSETDVGAAISGSNTDAGRLGEPMTALAPHSSNCLIMGCHTSLWLMRGDPTAGGEIVNLDKNIGILDRQSWCHAPANADGSGPRLLVFLSQDGVYVVPAGCEGDLAPQKLSRLRLPEELLNIDRSSYTCLMAYDVRDQGVHLFVTPNATGGTAQHWFIDWTTKGFFQVTLGSENYDPFSICARRDQTSTDSVVMLGGRDGYIRHFKRSAEDDDGTDFTSHVDYGPLPADFNGVNEGLFLSMSATLAENSAYVDWAVRAGNSPEAAYGATAQASGTWREDGLNPTNYPRVRGSDFILRLSNGQDGEKWGMERLIVDIEQKGRNYF
jgi:hypothetical protein